MNQRATKLTPDEEARARALFDEQMDRCARYSIQPDTDWACTKAEWESIPPDTRRAMLWPEPVDEDLRELYTARYRAYETPRAGWGL